MTDAVKWVQSGLVAGCAALAGLVAAPAAQAQDGPNSGAIGFELGADVVTQYFFRGYEQEDSGFIFQPYVNLGIDIYEGEDTLNSVGIYFGTWSSWHSEETGASGSGPAWWYEADLYAGVAVTMIDVLTVDVSYVGYFYPSGAATDIHELDILVGLDDSPWLNDFAVSPYVLFAIEFDNQAGDENAYVELGIEPSFALVDSAEMPIELSIPVAVGLSLDDYYTSAGGDDETWGFVSVGAILSAPLTFVPEDLGAWSASAGAVFMYLNDDVALNDGDDDWEVYGTFGLAMEY